MADRATPRERLLAAVLAAQIDGGRDDFDAEASLERLRRGEPLGPEDRRLLLSSPAARARMSEALGIADAALAARARAAQIELEALPLVAASHDAVTTVEARGWRLSIFREDLPRMAWSLTLQLGDEIGRLAPARVRVVDEGGLCWIEGRPDARAELSAPWPLAANTPIERLASHRLHLELLAI